MRASEFIIEGLNHPCIVIDVQPEYGYYGDNAGKCENIIKFVTKQTGAVLMFINAEDSGVSSDTRETIVKYWEDVVYESQGYDEDDVYNLYDDNPNYNGPIDWSRFTVVDKGYGYLRSWHDQGVKDAVIIKAIRMMYQKKVSDSRELFGGEESDTYEEGMRQLLGDDYLIGMGDPISVNWISVAQLKRFSGAYVVGGGRNECLREVTLLMNAFNIKYKLIDSLVY